MVQKVQWEISIFRACNIEKCLEEGVLEYFQVCP